MPMPRTPSGFRHGDATFGTTMFTAAPLGLWTPSTSISTEAMLLIAGLFLALALLFFVLHRRQAKPPPDLFTPSSDPQQVDDILQKATDERVRMDLVCSRQGVSHRQLQGLCVLPEKHSRLNIALHGTVTPEDWKDAPVDIYFHFTQERQKTFYHFSSFVQNICKQDGTILLTLPRPSMLTNNQRRDFVRIIPGAGMIHGVTAWQYAPGMPTLPGHVSQLGRPHYAFRPPQLQLLQVMDISGSGIRLRLSLPQVQQQPTKLAVGLSFCLLLILDSLGNDDKKLQLWLECSCRRLQAVSDKQHVDAGMQFTHWCLTPNLTDPIAWELVEQDGEVPPLLRWVGRVNVLLNRLTE